MARGADERLLRRRQPAERETFIGGSDCDDDRVRWCWDLVWVDPVFAALAEHLGLSADPLPAPWEGEVGGVAGACVEVATALLGWLLRGRVRAGGFGSEQVELRHPHYPDDPVVSADRSANSIFTAVDRGATETA